MLRISPSQKDKPNKDIADHQYKDREYYHEIRDWTTQHNFKFPPPLIMNDNLGVAPERFRAILAVPSKNTSLYYLLSQSNPWLDCEMTREKRALLKPHVGEISYAVICDGTAASSFFRNETVVDIANIYLWPLLHSRAEDVVACRTFADWRQLFTRTISLAFADYEYWRTLAKDPFVSISDKRRTARILKYMTPARILYLLTTSAGFWPYGGAASSSRSRNVGGGLCCIKPKIKDYTDETKIEWLVGAEFLRKMKRVHIFIAPPNATMTGGTSSSVYDTTDDDDE
jgi:hypothetical protein